MEHRGGDREAFEQDGETINHDGTPDQAALLQYDGSYRIHHVIGRTGRRPYLEVPRRLHGRDDRATDRHFPAAMQRAQHSRGIYARRHSRMERP
ncbi:hypothetical protein G6F40_017073 [Rhizopus arrhizus]|nr:hypothetical protein G6F40_017073 [Rhizopus arrhizus]